MSDPDHGGRGRWIEPVVGIPILGINVVPFWYALRENGFDAPLTGAARRLTEF